jgi:NTE family protein
LLIGDVFIEGVNEKQARYFENSIKKYLKENIEVGQFYKQYERLLANENVRTVYPSLCYNTQSGKYDLTLDIQITDPFNVGFGLYISSSGVNEAYLDLGLRWLGRTSKKIDINGYFGTFYNGVNAYAKFEKQGSVPLDLRVGFLVSRKNYFSNTRFFFEDEFPAYIIIDENYADLNIGIPVGIAHTLRIGISNININYKYYEDNYFTRHDTADLSNCYFLNPYIEFERNNLNRKQYASKGSRFFLGFNFYSGNEHYIPGTATSGTEEYKKNIDFFVLKTRYEQYFNISRPFDLGVTAEVEYSNKPILGNYVSSLLLADQYEPIPAMKTLFLENYRANTYGGVGVRFVFHLIRNLDVRAEGYYYVPYRKILVVERSIGAEYSKPFSYQFGIGKLQAIYHTPVGPVSISVNYLDKIGDKYSFLFNFGYLIFNRSRFYR